MLEDIAVVTGGTAIFEELGIKLENVELHQLGRAKKIRIDKDNTTIIEGAGDEKAIKGRIASLKARSRTRPAITTKKNCRSGWRSWPAALHRSTSGRPPKSR